MSSEPSLRRFLFPKTYVRKARELWWRARYDAAAFQREEMAKFAAAGFDRDAALRDLEAHLAKMGLPPFARCGDMASVHWILFSCLRRRYSFRRILEIGTFDGQTTALLASLFPASEIVTVDLPPEDPIVARTYDYARGEGRERAFEERVRKNLGSSAIRRVKKNSFFLPETVQGKFDLIWLDGGHLYPEVAWDICNAYHLCESGGFLLCDDVIPREDGLRDEYVSPDSWTVLRYVVERTRDPLALFLKRDSAFWSADPRERKFVAMLVKSGRPPVPPR